MVYYIKVMTWGFIFSEAIYHKISFSIAELDLDARDVICLWEQCAGQLGLLRAKKLYLKKQMNENIESNAILHVHFITPHTRWRGMSWMEIASFVFLGGHLTYVMSTGMCVV